MFKLIKMIFISSVMGVGAVVLLCVFLGRSAPRPVTENRARLAQPEALTYSVTTPAQAETAPSVPAETKSAVIGRCTNQMEQYGATMIKACVDQDLAAYEKLEPTRSEGSKLYRRCEKQMGTYGWTMVKSCVDQDSEAQKALSKY